MNIDITSSIPKWPFVVMTPIITLYLVLQFADNIGEGGAVGMALAALVVLVPLALTASVVRLSLKPRFVLTETGIQNAFLTEEIAWNEIAYIKIDEWPGIFPVGSLEIAVRDDVEIIPRVTRLWNWLARLYGESGPVHVFTALHQITSPMPLKELGQEIERRAGRHLVVSAFAPVATL